MTIWKTVELRYQEYVPQEKISMDRLVILSYVFPLDQNKTISYVIYGMDLKDSFGDVLISPFL